MRKIKKINGFLVVKFNDREKREYEGTALGEYGVIDAEVYTGNLDIDRGAMEYDDADTLEVAVELARGLESEEDITDEPPTYTAAVETNESYTEEAVEPAALIEGWTRRLATQVKSKHYPDTDPRTAAHELYGFKMALRQIGFLPESEVITDPDTFGAGRLDGPKIFFLERRYFFSIILSEFLKNRVALQKGRTAADIRANAKKVHGGKAENYSYFDLGEAVAVGESLIDLSERYKIYSERIVNKYHKYKELFCKYKKFIVLCNAVGSFCLTSKEISEEILALAKETEPNLGGFTLCILRTDSDGKSEVDSFCL